MSANTEPLSPLHKFLNPAVALLTAGKDQPYAFGLATALSDKEVGIDLIVGDELDTAFLRNMPGIRLLNLRGDQSIEADLFTKIRRICVYYLKLICYAFTSRAPVFHILWNNKLEYFDRTLLTLYYRLLRKRVVITLHNVNAGRRDKGDSWLNRATLRIQYGLADHLFVHTEQMCTELAEEFHVPRSKVTVIPFGINNAAPQSDITAREAKRILGVGEKERTILFFGRIAPYKGLEDLVAAFRIAKCRIEGLKLVIAGRPDRCKDYWNRIWEDIQNEVQNGQILVRAEFVPDAQTELYFKAADALVLPYRDIYQSGVLFLAYSFGLPVLASDAGCLKDEIAAGVNGFTFRRESETDLADVIERYFRSSLYRELDSRRTGIRWRAYEMHSWDAIAQTTVEIYRSLERSPARPTGHCAATPSR